MSSDKPDLNFDIKNVVDFESMDFRLDLQLKQALGKAIVISMAGLVALSNLENGKDVEISRLMMQLAGRPENIKNLLASIHSLIHVLVKEDVVLFDEFWRMVVEEADSDSPFLPREVLDEFYYTGGHIYEKAKIMMGIK